jgi:type II secretory pathway component GspD/PulD (secretin)
LLRRLIAAWCCVAAVTLGAASAWAQQRMEIIPLRHRTVQQVLPALRPLLEPGGVLTGRSNQLIVRSSARNLEQIRAALEAIDTPLRQLRILVRFGDGSESHERDISARGVLQPGGSRAELRARGSDASADARVDQSIRVLEGGRAYIALGETRPLGGAALTVQELATGFVVVPRIAGDRVILEIDPQRESPTQSPGGASVQRIATTVSARLGEWIELGGTSSVRSAETGGILSSGVRRGASGSRVWVKVEEIGP